MPRPWFSTELESIDSSRVTIEWCNLNEFSKILSASPKSFHIKVFFFFDFQFKQPDNETNEALIEMNPRDDAIGSDWSQSTELNCTQVVRARNNGFQLTAKGETWNRIDAFAITCQTRRITCEFAKQCRALKRVRIGAISAVSHLFCCCSFFSPSQEKTLKNE